jgi:hypothetical protein
MVSCCKRFWLPWLVLVLAVGLQRSPAHADARAGGSTRHWLGRLFHAGIESARETSFCFDLFASARVPHTDLCIGGALKLSQPSLSQLAAARAEGRRPRRLFLAYGVSNSLMFVGHNPLFGGWNGSYSVPVGQGLGAGLFAGGPYTGFFVDTPFLLSLGGWVQERDPPRGRAPPEPFAAVTLTVPGLSRAGIAVGARIWIFSPALQPLVRPLRRPAWWLHNRRMKVQRTIGRKLGPVARRIGRRLGPVARRLGQKVRQVGRCVRCRLARPRSRPRDQLSSGAPRPAPRAP